MSSVDNYQARIVTTGTTASGREGVVSDEDSTTRAVTPTFTVADVWSIGSVPPKIGDPSLLNGALQLDPPAGGVLVRMVCFPPDSEWKGTPAYEEAMAAIGGADSHHGDDEVAGMHATDTIDIITVVEGEIHAILEDGEVVLKPGDSLVQNGTKHAWSNRTDKPAAFVATMVSAQR